MDPKYKLKKLVMLYINPNASLVICFVKYLVCFYLSNPFSRITTTSMLNLDIVIGSLRTLRTIY